MFRALCMIRRCLMIVRISPRFIVSPPSSAISNFADPLFRRGYENANYRNYSGDSLENLLLTLSEQEESLPTGI